MGKVLLHFRHREYIPPSKDSVSTLTEDYYMDVFHTKYSEEMFSSVHIPFPMVNK